MNTNTTCVDCQEAPATTRYTDFSRADEVAGTPFSRREVCESCAKAEAGRKMAEAMGNTFETLTDSRRFF